MSAIQRWFFLQYDHEPYKCFDPLNVPFEDQWCNAADVAQLEELIASQQKTHQEIVDGLRRQLWDSDQALRATQAEHGKLRQAYAHLEHRYETLMERREPPMSAPG